MIISGSKEAFLLHKTGIPFFWVTKINIDLLCTRMLTLFLLRDTGIEFSSILDYIIIFWSKSGNKSLRIFRSKQ